MSGYTQSHPYRSVFHPPKQAPLGGNFALNQYFQSQNDPWVVPNNIPQGEAALHAPGQQASQNQWRGAQPSECDTLGDSGYGGSMPTPNPDTASHCSQPIIDHSQDVPSLIHDISHLGVMGRRGPGFDQGGQSYGPRYSSVTKPSLRCTYAGCKKPMCKTRSELNKHEQRHKKPHKCDVSGCKGQGGFGTVNDLERHKQSVHNQVGTRYVCPDAACARKGKLWPRPDNFRAHLERVHKKTIAADELGPFIHRPQGPTPYADNLLRGSGSTFDTPARPADIPAELLAEMTSPHQGQFRVVSHYFAAGAGSYNTQVTQSQETRQLDTSMTDVPKFSPGAYQDPTPILSSPAPDAVAQDNHDRSGIAPTPDNCLGSSDPTPMAPMEIDGPEPDPMACCADEPIDIEPETPPSQDVSVDDSAIAEPEMPHAQDHPSISLELKGPEQQTNVPTCIEPRAMTLSSPPSPLPPSSSYSPPSPFPLPCATPTAEGSVLGGMGATKDASTSLTTLGDEDISLDSIDRRQVGRMLERLEATGLLDALVEKFGYTQSKKQMPPSVSNDDQPSNQTSAASSKADSDLQCPTCSKHFSRRCELKKHMKRHDRPYGCTFTSVCQKIFGSKNDWKRHENSQHFQVEVWKCDYTDSGPSAGKECGKVSHRRENFRCHLQRDHSLRESEIEHKLTDCRIGRHCEGAFWCGFCKKRIPLKNQGQAGWNERFDHIDDHFFGKNCDRRHIGDWEAIDPDQKSLDDSGAESDHGVAQVVQQGKKRCRSMEAPRQEESPAKRVRVSLDQVLVTCCQCQVFQGLENLHQACPEDPCGHVFCDHCTREQVPQTEYSRCPVRLGVEFD